MASGVGGQPSTKLKPNLCWNTKVSSGGTEVLLVVDSQYNESIVSRRFLNTLHRHSPRSDNHLDYRVLDVHLVCKQNL